MPSSCQVTVACWPAVHVVDATGEVIKTLANAEAARAREMTALLNILLFTVDNECYSRECGGTCSMCRLILEVETRE